MRSIEKREIFLQETKYLDFTHREIKKIAYEITGSAKTDKEKADILFYWVKEKIRFEFGYWGIKASEVLRRKRGMCTNKVNLLIAFLRSVRIPAGYGILRVETKEFYRELMCPIFRKLVSPTTVHIYAGIFLNGKWLRCDPSMDSELAKALKEKTPFAKMTGFNISEKEMRKIKGILKREEFLANIDENLDKPPKHAKGITLRILNSYLKFLREKGGFLQSFNEKQIEKKFLKWLSERYSSYFRFLTKSF